MRPSQRPTEGSNELFPQSFSPAARAAFSNILQPRLREAIAQTRGAYRTHMYRKGGVLSIRITSPTGNCLIGDITYHAGADSFVYAREPEAWVPAELEKTIRAAVSEANRSTHQPVVLQLSTSTAVKGAITDEGATGTRPIMEQLRTTLRGANVELSV